ncbi:MAG: hypothetical protein ACYTF7_05475, partial [Planctomycetota bacterium]
LLVGGGITSDLWRLVVLCVGVGGMGMVSSRLLGLQWGMWNAGVVVAWIASSVTTGDLLRLTRDEGVLRVLLLESAGVLILGGVLMIALTRAARGQRARLTRGSFGELAPSLIASLCVCGVVVWMVAREGVAGQLLWACSGGALAGGLVGCVIWTRAAPIGLVLVPPVLGLSVLLIRTIVGVEGQVEAAMAGTMWPVLTPTPLQWLAGALLGVPVGMSWGISLAESRLEGESEGISPTNGSVEA